MSNEWVVKGYEVPAGAVGYSPAGDCLRPIFYGRHGDELVFTVAGEPVNWMKSLTLRDNIEWFPAIPATPGRIAAHEFLERGAQHMRDRASQRDAPDGERSMARCVAAFNAQEGTNLTETQGWRFMIQLKYARSVHGSFVADDYEDLCAYAGLAGEAAQ